MTKTVEEANLLLAELRLAIEFNDKFDPLRRPGINYVPGVGNYCSPKVMFIGEAPGPMENVKGVPFIGGAGKIFRQLLMDNKFVADEIFVTNVMKYMPCKPDSMDFRRPTPQEVRLATDYLSTEIQIVEPEVVCLMGNVPIQAYFPGQTSVSKLRGEWIEQEGSPSVYVTYHPSSIQYDHKKLWIVQKDFRAVSDRVHKD